MPARHLNERNHVMFTNHQESLSNYQLITILNDMCDAGCDRDFDAVYDDLEREFAERRLQLGNE
jgi:hypothetical protein